MADPTLPQVTRSYLAQLERSLAGVPVDVRDEIVAGVREELDGLNAAAAAVRIEALGDPEFIATEARTETAAAGSNSMPVGHPGQRPLRTPEPGWFPMLAALLVAFGGVVIPVVGWAAGLGLVWLSKTWRLRDKWIATLTPFAAAGAFVLIFALTSMAAHTNPIEPPSPLIPGFTSAIWSSVVLAIPVNGVIGIWLLWRAKQIWAPREDSPQTLPAAPRLEHPSTSRRRPQASWYAPVTLLLIIAG